MTFLDPTQIPDPFAGSEWTGAKEGTTPKEETTPDIGSQPIVVQVQVKTQYGAERFYPMDDIGECFLEIQGGKTLTMNTLRLMARLGYEIKFNHKEVVL